MNTATNELGAVLIALPEPLPAMVRHSGALHGPAPAADA